MAHARALKDKFIGQLDELIQSGEKMPMKEHSREIVTNASILYGHKKYRHYNLASFPEFVEWRTTCIAVLDQAVPKDSLLRNTVDSFYTLNNEPSKVDFGVAFLKSVRNALDRGSLDSLAMQIEATVIADYMSQATTLLTNAPPEEASHIPAAVLAGATLERALRTICEGLEPPEPIANGRGEFLGMTSLIDALKKRSVFNEIRAKQLRSWAAIRNSAAHGKIEEFDRHQVKQMLEGVENFFAQHLQ